MSGGSQHNPNGRQAQLASGWNHLQVPNYYPRQPQAAHMSSHERSALPPSPLTWHTPTPAPAKPHALYRHTPTPPDPAQVQPHPHPSNQLPPNSNHNTPTKIRNRDLRSPDPNLSEYDNLSDANKHSPGKIRNRDLSTLLEATNPNSHLPSKPNNHTPSKIRNRDLASLLETKLNKNNYISTLLTEDFSYLTETNKLKTPNKNKHNISLLLPEEISCLQDAKKSRSKHDLSNLLSPNFSFSDEPTNSSIPAKTRHPDLSTLFSSNFPFQDESPNSNCSNKQFKTRHLDLSSPYPSNFPLHDDSPNSNKLSKNKTNHPDLSLIHSNALPFSGEGVQLNTLELWMDWQNKALKVAGATASTGAGNVYRHTPTPPDRDAIIYHRHTPTPPDKLFRHTPPPNELKAGGASAPIFRSTPPPADARSALYSLQQAMAAAVDSQRRDDVVRGSLQLAAESLRAEEALSLSRHSPAPGSVDLSNRARPANGAAPLALSVRDAGRINSLLAASAPHTVIVATRPSLREALPHQPVIVNVKEEQQNIADTFNKESLTEKAKIPTKEPPPPIINALKTCPELITVETDDITNKSESEKAIDTEKPLENGETEKQGRKRRISFDEVNSPPFVSKTRRKTYSESETIANIAAMVSADILDGEPANEMDEAGRSVDNEIRTVDNLKSVLSSPTPQDPPPDPVIPKSPADTTVNKVVVQSRESSSMDAVPETIESEKETPLAEISEVEPSASSTAAPQPAATFVEVENELEKMFAGIEEEPPALNKTIAHNENLLAEELVHEPGSMPGSSKARTNARKSSRRTSEATSAGLLSSDEARTPKKKKRPIKKRSSIKETNFQKKKSSSTSVFPPKISLNRNKLKAKDTLNRDAYDSGSNASSCRSRGPYVKIRGPRDSPLSVNVVNNAPPPDDDSEKSFNRSKAAKSKAITDADFRNNLRSKGLHSSTLSMRYDATKADANWMCVFCKKGSHARVSAPSAGFRGATRSMGDLFGPYTISSDCDEFRSMSPETFEATQATSPLSKGNRPARRKSTKSECEVKDEKLEENFAGMIHSSSSENEYEVWTHEECAVWAPGVLLVGRRVSGLAGAVWSCCRARCVSCGLGGAGLACLRHSCRQVAHYHCAKDLAWSLDEDDFRAFCTKHAPPPP